MPGASATPSPFGGVGEAPQKPKPKRLTAYERERLVQLAKEMIANGFRRHAIIETLTSPKYQAPARQAEAIINAAFDDLRKAQPTDAEYRLQLEEMLMNNYRRAHVKGDMRGANQACFLLAQLFGMNGAAEMFEKLVRTIVDTEGADGDAAAGLHRLKDQLVSRAARGNIAALGQAQSLTAALMRRQISEGSKEEAGPRGLLVLPEEDLTPFLTQQRTKGGDANARTQPSPPRGDAGNVPGRNDASDSSLSAEDESE